MFGPSLIRGSKLAFWRTWNTPPEAGQASDPPTAWPGIGTCSIAGSVAITNGASTHYVLGTAFGPHPFPMMVRDFQAVIGREAKKQIMKLEGRLPDALIACVGGGSNAIGLFHEFLDEPEVAIWGVEAAGKGIETGEHAASLTAGRPGVLHGNRTYLLQNEDGQIVEAHSLSAGLDYPGIGPGHAALHDTGPAG